MKKFRELSGKLVVAMLAVTLLIGCAIGGTVAWLTANTAPVVNTFTYGDINIDLWETKDGMHTESRLNENGYVVNARSDLKIIPGVDLPKDPTVTVKAGSEACWLFVKVEKSGTFVTNKVTYSIDDTVWTQLDNVAGVYYKKIETLTASETDYNILKDKKVTVSQELTKGEINSIEEGQKNPTLTFKAYAVQLDAAQTAADAWAIANPTTTP